MKAIKVLVDDGRIVPEEPLESGRHEAILVMLDPDPWEQIIDDPRPRPALNRAGGEAMDDFFAGKTTPLDPDKMT